MYAYRYSNNLTGHRVYQANFQSMKALFLALHAVRRVDSYPHDSITIDIRYHTEQNPDYRLLLGEK